MIKNTHRNQKGFTIIELMIATAVLSTILVLVTGVMVNIGSLYYKGINQASIQDDVRTISDEVVKDIQLNDQAPISATGASNTKFYCIGQIRYAYIEGVQIGHPAPGTGTVYHQVLWRDINPVSGDCPTQINPHDPSSPQLDLTDVNLATEDASNNGQEMITSSSRLTEFSMVSDSRSTAVTVGAAYGDDDLLCNPSAAAGSCDDPAAMTSWSDYTGDVRCKGLKGKQFCSTAHITSAAVSRVAGG
jgi:prepilin-type N-terminal cleavage/methylation domain-containing protein